MEVDNVPPDGGGGGSGHLDPNNRRKRPSNLEPIEIPSKMKSVNPSASKQHTFIIPEYAEGAKITYSQTDVAPFVVHVSRTEPDPSAGLTIRLLKMAQFLHKNEISGIVKDGIKASGRNRIVVEFTNAESANNFICNPILTNNNYSAIIPSFHVTRQGIVRDIPIDWSMEELVSNLECPGTNTRAFKARRLNRKLKQNGEVSWIPTQTVVLSFLGQRLPAKISCYKTSLPVEIYQLPTIQCNSCCRFGHIKAQCRSKPRCFKCAQNHTGDSCSVPESKISCLFCSGPHMAINPHCPEHNRQRSIKLVMAEENLPYSEASLRFKPTRLSFADALRSPSHISETPSPMPASQKHSVPIHMPNSPSPNRPSSSYKKTIYMERAHKPSLGKGYDVESHRDITSTPKSSQKNGCALNSSHEESDESTNDNFADLLMRLLINCLNRFNDILPYNGSELLYRFISASLKNGSNNSSME